ncbi:FAD-binding oxidoreductase [Paraflavitalea sp. CAU 1676]|uniref:FAD-binding oxidoreductase n=1 Tax=Paraflavitalea sp. CAU 1676 TaxID=3032598 RepID=UPI0023DBAFDF|nr:FAD-binding oxidoreductase [Paraflavitalea sp. CAU 1676]MDF2190919.1 FAD-binding oxidoreductase [Paraflavitalea sp. CAU 1676]
MKRMLTLKRVILLVLFVVLLLIARPFTFVLYHWYKDPAPTPYSRTGYSNDASRISETPVDTIIRVAGNRDEAIDQLVQLVHRAAGTGKNISIAGARHSMGAHTISRDGIILDMTNFNYLELDTASNLLTAGAGARWAQIIPYLHQNGRSVAVMQSNNSFTVGGSISVNCHGWQPNSPPIAGTVESFRLINAAGQLITCDRNNHPELFSLVLGGYGLFGIIVDVRLRVVPNVMYKVQQYVIRSEDYIKKFNEVVNSGKPVGMVYGRVNINPSDFMQEAILSVFTVDSPSELVSLKETGFKDLRRAVFRGSANSGYGKNLRWKLEKWSARLIDGKSFSRNQLINEPVEVFQNTQPGYTDILHEYFIPTDSVVRFIEVLRDIIPQHKVDLLNITLRNVKQDEDTYLRYANREVFGFVMLYNQAITPDGEQAMKALTQTLIDKAMLLGGTYYLPYRLHATREQLFKAYPMAGDFFAKKKLYDSLELFQNQFYVQYK